jgi:hypothetical protein
MTELTITDEITGRRALGLRHAAALSAVVAFGLLAPAAADASPTVPAEPPPGPDDVTSNPTCDPGMPCEIDPEPEPCDPATEICDFTSGGDGPDDPCDNENPPESCDPGGGDPGGDPGEDETVVPQGTTTVEVDVPVLATPNFTG